MLNFPGMRPTAEVVAILNKTPRRAQIVGILNSEGTGDVLRLIPCDPRMPHMMVNASSMPSGIQQSLQVCREHAASCLACRATLPQKGSGVAFPCSAEFTKGLDSTND